MRIIFTIFSFFVVLISSAFAQSATLVQKAVLTSPTLDEISGCIEWDGKLYGHTDSGTPNLFFELDSTTGAIIKTITLEGATNVDWEDITQDDTYFYLGDFGNNANGSRKDLKFYRIPKQAVSDISGATGTIPANQIETINFSYENQDAFCPTDFTCSSAANKNRFDCEAVIYHNGNLHLFTKNWVTAYTVHYIIPAVPGIHIAQKKDSLDTQGILITSATKTNDKIVVLLGYTNLAITGSLTSCALWLITGFTDMDNLFTTATGKQKIGLGLAGFNGQTESITAVKQTRVLVTNEETQGAVPARLYGLNLDNFISQDLLPAGLSDVTSRLINNQVILSWKYEDPGADYFVIESSNTGNNDFTTVGKVYANSSPSGSFTYTDNNSFTQATKYYRIKVVKQSGGITYSEILFVKQNNNHLFNLVAAPSPFNDKITVSFYSDTQQNVHLSLVDIFGRNVHNRELQCAPGAYTVSLDALQGLSKGVYFLTTRTKSYFFVRRIVKQ